MKKLLLLPAAGLFLYSCGNNEEQKTENTAFSDPITTHIDSSISPGENFFRYANNSWFKANPIPASESSNGIFRTIQDTINASIRKICEASAADTKAAKGSNKQKIGDLYFSGMDTAGIEKTGLSPLKADFDKIDAIKTMPELVNEVAELYKMNVRSMFGFAVTRDDKKSSQYIVYLGQARLGLPERDYYFNTDSRTINIRNEYVKHMQKMLELSGTPTAEAEKNAKSVMGVETAIAKASRKMEDLRDPYKNYNKMTLEAFSKTNPSVNWPQTLEKLGLKNIDSVVVGQPEFFTQLESTMKKTGINDWKAYLKWTLLNSYANTANKSLENQNFYFYSTVLEGVKEQKPRWKRIVGMTDNSLGELIGQVYVDEYLPKGTKEKLLEIGNNIRDIYAEHIKKLDWMSDVTKQKALSKLNKIVMKVGYPDKWKDMSALEISRDNYLQNVINIDKWEYNFMISKYGKPVDLTEWDMYPQTYNAYYNPASNEIVVPACNIIVPGFEGRMPDDAVLYGIIGGSTFGHEITHGFDDQGSLYDENGNLADWWTKEDREKFVAKTKLIVEQFNNYTVLDSMHVRGENTQGENIADLGGVIMGYEAFKKTKQGQSTELINGYTPDQRYFLAYAYAWMVQPRDAMLAKQIMSDVHSPAEFRINGPLSDIDQFYTAFNIKKGDKMYRDENVRVKIW
jgi:putative endopeptidase